MKAVTALASILDTAAFLAKADGEVIEANAPFAQLLRCMSGDDWRVHVDEDDRALVDSYWGALFVETDKQLEPLRFHLTGVDATFLLRAQTIGESGHITGAAATIEVEPSTTVRRWRTDQGTGLLEIDAVLDRVAAYIEDGTPFVAAVVLLGQEDSEDDIRRKEAARQLLTTIRPTDLLTSSPDGRFVLCAAGAGNESAATALAERMTAALHVVNAQARVGLALATTDAGPATLLREAEAGAYASDWGGFSFAPEP